METSILCIYLPTYLSTVFSSILSSSPLRLFIKSTGADISPALSQSPRAYKYSTVARSPPSCANSPGSSFPNVSTAVRTGHANAPKTTILANVNLNQDRHVLGPPKRHRLWLTRRTSNLSPAFPSPLRTSSVASVVWTITSPADG